MSLPPDDDRTVLAAGQGTPAPARKSVAAERAANALPVGARLGEFEITRVLGEGGFGIVYLAYDSALERNVALKEYMPSAFAARSTTAHVSVRSDDHQDTFEAGLRSFVNEARILAQFDHPALIKVYRFWEANGTAYMVMPYYQGQTLKQALLARGSAPDEAWLKALLAPLLDTLALIHEQQCFHRDIAPDNIMMLEDTHPLLLDFGAARRAISGMDQAFTVIVKQSYAPIEQYAEMPGMSQGAWTDLFALASVVHFAIAGQPPPPAVGRIMADTYVPLASRYADRYSAEFLAAIDRALSVRPEERPQSAAEMRELLGLAEGAAVRTQLVAASPVRPPPPPPVPEAPAPAPTPPRSGRRLAVGAAVAAAVLAAALLGYTLMGDKAPPVAPVAIAPAPAPALPVASSPVQPTVAAASPAIAAAPPAAADAPFEPIDALRQVLGGASPDRMVTVQVAQPRVQIKRDRLSFSVRASHAGYLYVQMVGTNRTDYWMLFPNAVDKDNYVKAGQTLTLPRSKWKMVGTGPAGIDQFVAIISDVPRDFTGAGLVKGDPFSEFPIARARQMQRSHTGATPLFAGAPECAGVTPCSTIYGASMFSIEEYAR
jgi:serine/threonine protein kinase